MSITTLLSYIYQFEKARKQNKTIHKIEGLAHRIVHAFLKKRSVMYNYTRDGITIVTVLDKRTQRADGIYPIRIRVNHNRTRKYIPTGKNLTKEEFESLSTTRNRSLSDIRKSIEESFYVVKENIDVCTRKASFHFMHSTPVWALVQGEQPIRYSKQK